jgi:hypothetical protein
VICAEELQAQTETSALLRLRIRDTGVKRAVIDGGRRSTTGTVPSAPSEQTDRAPEMRFVCDTGYSRELCRTHLTALEHVLSTLEVGALGGWTWVLVRSDEWRPILRRVSRDPDSPAFTILEKRQTFLEEALFRPVPERSATLLAKFRLPLDRLLEHAILHELGHAICMVRDERRATDCASELRPLIGVTPRRAESPAGDPFKSVKVFHPVLRQLVAEGHARSATFRGLVTDLDASDWLVFVQPGPCPEKAAVACLLHVVGEFEGSRYIRLLVNHKHRHPDNVIATLAHEMQHALEVAQAPEVKDTATMRALFERIETVRVRSATATAYETAAARQIGEQVLRELDAARRAARR